jgi:hypothetical protein
MTPIGVLSLSQIARFATSLQKCFFLLRAAARGFQHHREGSIDGLKLAMLSN